MPGGLSEALSFVKGASELVGALRLEAKTSSLRSEAASLQELLDLLREIYFAPGGTRAILELVAGGERPSQQLVEAVLPRFNDFGFRWEQRENTIDFESTSMPLLGFHARETLHRIKVGKGGLRVKVQELLNEELTFGGEVSSDQAVELLGGIEKLNGEIADAEMIIMDLMKRIS